MKSTGAEIRSAYEIVQNIVVNETTEVFLEQFIEIFHQLGGFDTEGMEVLYEPPISYLSDIKPNEILTINEQREILGKEAIDGGDAFVVQLAKGMENKVDKDSVEEVIEEEKVITENEYMKWHAHLLINGIL